jgi:hypothetical protein
MKRSSCVVTLAVGLLTACSDGSTLQVSYSAVDAYADPALLTVDLLWPGGGRHLDGRRFTTTTEFGTPHSQVLDVPTGGQLQVRAYLTSANDTLAQVAGTLTLQPNYGYGASLLVGPTGSESFCSSVADRAPVLGPSAAVTSDTLFLELSGLQEGAIC